MTQHLKCAAKVLDLTTPKVMGVINLSENSFSPIGRCNSADEALVLAESMVEEGAAIIDIGAEPTNPYTDLHQSLQQQMDKVLPVLERLRSLPVPISIDTSEPALMLEAAKQGAGLINDVRALCLPGAIEMAAKLQLPVCLMHMEYPFGVSGQVPIRTPAELLSTILSFLKERITACEKAGISKDKIVIDPGFGGGNFGKTPAENCYLLAQLEAFLGYNCPLLVGVSRKTMIYRTLNITAEESLAGSLAAAVLAVAKGASIIRAHDVKETVHAVNMSMAILQASKESEKEAF
ncbi:MAG: folP [Gammaproteobacteria bacterium]|jgi:dihydropteroate synthase|nr:folP [Gammaproteobacteria bacterium]